VAGPRGRPAPAAGSLTGLVREAHRAGRLLDAVPLLRDAAGLRASLRPAAEPAAAAERLVTDGEQEPHLVCIPSFLAGSGPHQFVRLAAALPRRHRVRALTLPGYGPGESAPASRPAVVDALAEATRRAADRPFVLLGYSIGGALALATADALAEAGVRVAGVVLLDTFDPAGDQWPIFAWAMGQLLDRDPASVTVDDEGLLAMGAYLRLLEGWTPARPAAPSLLVGADPAGPQPRWPLWPGAGATVTVPGADHFSLVEEHAEQVAAAVDSWLGAPQTAAGAGVVEESR
jgi:thioesterase domain-containing protein